MRIKESVRFEDYYKLQFFDPISLCWRDVQKAYSSVAEAEANMDTVKQWRVMVITTKGRYPIQ